MKKFLLGIVVLLIGLGLSGCSKIQDAIEDGNVEAIVEMYNKADKKEKEKLEVEIANEYLDWLKDIKKDDRFKYPVLSNLQKWEKPLTIVDHIQSQHFVFMKEIKDEITMLRYLTESKEEWKNADYIGNIVDDYETQQKISRYVLASTRSTLENPYTDSYKAFTVYGYTNFYGKAVMTYKNEGIIHFKKDRMVSQGVVNVNVIKIGDAVVDQLGGTQNRVPVYLEVGPKDVEYSKLIDGIKRREKAFTEKITTIIDKTQPIK